MYDKILNEISQQYYKDNYPNAAIITKTKSATSTSSIFRHSIHSFQMYN